MSLKKKTLYACALTLWLSALFVPMLVKTLYAEVLFRNGFETAHLALFGAIYAGVTIAASLWFAFWITCRVE